MIEDWISVTLNKTGIYTFVFNPMMKLKKTPVQPLQPTNGVIENAEEQA